LFLCGNTPIQRGAKEVGPKFSRTKGMGGGVRSLRGGTVINSENWKHRGTSTVLNPTLPTPHNTKKKQKPTHPKNPPPKPTPNPPPTPQQTKPKHPPPQTKKKNPPPHKPTQPPPNPHTPTNNPPTKGPDQTVHPEGSNQHQMQKICSLRTLVKCA